MNSVTFGHWYFTVMGGVIHATMTGNPTVYQRRPEGWYARKWFADGREHFLPTKPHRDLKDGKLIRSARRILGTSL